MPLDRPAARKLGQEAEGLASGSIALPPGVAALAPTGGAADAETWDAEFVVPASSSSTNPLAGGRFRATLAVAGFPFDAPRVTFVTKVWHPCVAPADGALAPAVLGRAWTPRGTVAAAAGRVAAMLSAAGGGGGAAKDAALDDAEATAANPEAAKQDAAAYAAQAAQWAQEHAGADASSAAASASASAAASGSGSGSAEVGTTRAELDAVEDAGAVYDAWRAGAPTLGYAEFTKALMAAGMNSQRLRVGWTAVCDGNTKADCTRAQFEAWWSLGKEKRWTWFDVSSRRYKRMEATAPLMEAVGEPSGKGYNEIGEEEFELLVAMMAQAMPDTVDRAKEFSPEKLGRPLRFGDLLDIFSWDDDDDADSDDDDEEE